MHSQRSSAMYTKLLSSSIAKQRRTAGCASLRIRVSSSRLRSWPEAKMGQPCASLHPDEGAPSKLVKLQEHSFHCHRPAVEAPIKHNGACVEICGVGHNACGQWQVLQGQGRTKTAKPQCSGADQQPPDTKSTRHLTRSAFRGSPAQLTE